MLHALRIILLFLSLTTTCTGQIEFNWFATKWSDSFVEWQFYKDSLGEESTGELYLRWAERNDWSLWDFRFGERTGEIESQWEDLSRWILRSEGEQVTMRTRWPEDPSEWVISHSGTTLYLNARQQALLDDWEVIIDDTSRVDLYTELEGDYTVWLVNEEGEPIPGILKLAMVFLTIISSVPRF